jgi:uncharacterized protein (TIGR00645 family)
MSAPESDIILMILTLVDMSLVANLLLIIIFSGYENFVSKIDTAGHEDRPDWMGKVDFSGLKIKVIASIVAISAIELLKAFVNVSNVGTPGTPGIWMIEDKQLAWKVGIHSVLVLSGLLFALMDKIAESTPKHGGKNTAIKKRPALTGAFGEKQTRLLEAWFSLDRRSYVRHLPRRKPAAAGPVDTRRLADRHHASYLTTGAQPVSPRR